MDLPKVMTPEERLKLVKPGLVIRYMRELLGHTIDDVSVGTGIDSSLLIDFEYGQATPLVRELEVLAKFFDADVEELKKTFGYHDDKDIIINKSTHSLFETKLITNIERLEREVEINRRQINMAFVFIIILGGAVTFIMLAYMIYLSSLL